MTGDDETAAKPKSGGMRLVVDIRNRDPLTGVIEHQNSQRYFEGWMQFLAQMEDAIDDCGED